MDVDMSEMKYVNADGSEMDREEIIALLESTIKENEKKTQRICDLLNDKRKAYVEACKAEWSIKKKAELFAALPDELKDDVAARDIHAIPEAIDVMQYVCDCINTNVAELEAYDTLTGLLKPHYTKDRCKLYRTIAEGTFEDACMMFTVTSVDTMIDERVIIFDKEKPYSRLFIKGLRLQWQMIKENIDGTAGLRALFE